MKIFRLKGDIFLIAFLLIEPLLTNIQNLYIFKAKYAKECKPLLISILLFKRMVLGQFNYMCIGMMVC